MRCLFVKSLSILFVVVLAAAPATASPAADWPMWRHDAGHTAASPHDLPGELHLQWVRQYPARQPVWDDPLNRDMMPYDRIFEPVVAGGRMYLGFNDADKVVALDVGDGSEVWTFFAEGPVRFSPVVHGDSVLFSSDDGYLYCVGAADGVLRWRFRGGPSQRKVIGNRRVISSWPARGGPVVAGDTVYFAASIWPFMGTFIYALDAATGEVRWVNDGTGADFQKQPHSAPAFAGVAPQGQLAVAGDLLLVPGGRSLPAAFDRTSGKLQFFNFGAKGQGGSFVAANESQAFVHTRVRGTLGLALPGGAVSGFRVNEPVLAAEAIYTAREETKTDTPAPAAIEAYGRDHAKLWEIAADGTGDLIRAGSRLYAAGGGSITAIDLPRDNKPAEIAWSIPVEGEILRLVAAADRLFAVTLDGRILAFSEAKTQPPVLACQPQPLSIPAGTRQKAKELLATTGQREGYALWFGVEDPGLLAAVALESELHVVAVDPDAKKIDALRRQWDGAGLYGHRVALAAGTPENYLAPPYVANLVIVGPSLSARLADPRALARVYESVRPYGGKLWIESGEPLAGKLAVAKLAQGKLEIAGQCAVICREGALPGAADWTHAYGDVANSVKSNDRRVKPPLGVLWFGGISNLDILPRHGHGPSQQILGGRLFIQGVNSLSACDVYTGRVLWKREFEDLGTYQVYYDETYAETPLSTAYNQVHIPGANARGTNYVAAEEGVYLVLEDRCLLLDSASGATLREFVLPAGEDGKSPSWGYVGVYENLLLAGAGFANYSERLGYEYTPAIKKGPAWAPDRSASLGLLAFDRQSGKVLWKIDAAHSFLHNGIVAGGGRIYLLDKLPKRVEEQQRRRGGSEAAGYRLLAVEAATGKPVWQTDDVFGTWLSYSTEHDLLLQAGAAASDRGLDEVNRGLAVYQAANGTLVWKNADLSYAGPCILHGERLITNTTSYKESQGAFRLRDGKPDLIEDPVTGEAFAWRFVRTYGCNTAVASEHLLTFRSGAAGFYDLGNHGGVGNLGGFKSGCSSNLIVAGGVLTAPDYTRTCTCAYQNQTSLALVPMPENEIWTYNLFGQSGEEPREIRRIGINFGAPGDRLAENGTLWINYPPDDGFSPEIPLDLEGEPRWYCHHSSRITGGSLPWVAASGVEGLRKLTVRLVPQAKEESGIVVPVLGSHDDAEEVESGAVSLASSDLELVRDKSDQTIGLRFQKVPLAPGAKIGRAYVQFQVDEPTDVPTRLEIRGQAADDAPVFAATPRDITSRPTTETAVVWEPRPWTKNAPPGPDHQTPDLAAVLGEIIGRPGWRESNALALVIRGTGKRVAASANGSRERSPKLVIETGDDNGQPPRPAARPHLVRLVFAEPEAGIRAGDRVFDVVLQGNVVASKLDIAAKAGGPRRMVTASWTGIPIGETLEIQLTPHGEHEPVLCGVEIVREGGKDE